MQPHQMDLFNFQYLFWRNSFKNQIKVQWNICIPGICCIAESFISKLLNRHFLSQGAANDPFLSPNFTCICAHTPSLSVTGEHAFHSPILVRWWRWLEALWPGGSIHHGARSESDSNSQLE